ncbi:MAG TPA: DinB family protein [Phycisphaerae bacterium]|nr:DinB family protein [Phycisphaerae bacterium]
MAQKFLREFFAYNDWAREKTFELSAGLSAEQLDRPFEMGMGSIRETLYHIWAAEDIWYQRWAVEPSPKFKQEKGLALDEVRARGRDTAERRNTFLKSVDEAKLAAPHTFTNIKGETFSLPLGGQMQHVCNHGIHHRAQFVNMLRHVGGTLPKPGLDYIFYRLEKNTEPAPAMEREMVRDYQMYADWGTRRLLAIAAQMSDEQLDRRFEMGVETVRKTFRHLANAEKWWQQNWSGNPGGAFPPSESTESAADLSKEFDAVWKARDSFFAGLRESDLGRAVTAKPRPDFTIQFPLGVTLVQLCGHATHHRAQILNMYRHLGVEVPAMDLVVWLRDKSK